MNSERSWIHAVVVVVLVAVCCCVGVAREAKAHLSGGSSHCDSNHSGPRCWCKIRAGCTGYVVRDFGALCQYHPLAINKQAHCATMCSNAASAYGAPAVQAAGQSICAGTGPGNWPINAFSVVGAKDWENNACDSDQSFGRVACRAVPEVCKCPPGWIGDNGVDGGVTTNQRKCARLACQPITVAPPPNDTKIGTGTPLPWGFSWGNAFYQFGSKENGGVAACSGGGWAATWQ